MLRDAARAVIVALALVTTAACSDSSGPSGPPPGPSDPVTGDFALVTVDGTPLPVALLTETGYSLQVTQSTAEFEENGTFLVAVTTRETFAGFASTYVDTLRGSWTQSEGTVNLTLMPGGATGQATWDGVELTVELVVATVPGQYAFRRADE